MMESQRPILYLTLLFLGFMIWTTWQQDQVQKLNAPTVAGSAGSASNEVAPANPTTTASATPATATNVDTPTASSVPAAPNTVAASGDVPQQVVAQNSVAAVPVAQANTNPSEHTVRVKTDVLDLIISTKGGDIVQSDLPTYPVSLEEPDKPVRLLDRAGRDYVAQSGLLHIALAGSNAKRAPTHHDVFQAGKSEYSLGDGQEELVVPLTWQSADGVLITKRYRFKRGEFLFELEHEIQNNSPYTWTGNEYRQFRQANMNSGSRLFMPTYTGAAYYNDKYVKLPFDDFSDEGFTGLSIKTGWAAMMEHYFLTTWLPNEGEDNSYYTNIISDKGRSSYILGLQSPQKSVATGQTDSFKTVVYIGPKLQRHLEEIRPGLELTADYGIFAFIAKPLFWVMDHIHWAVGNWGWTIILVTLLIKILFFYPSAASYRSMAKLRAFAPRMKQITERYANDSQGKQKALMDLYKKEKINPLGGCLPMLIQIPVFIALYWVLLESVELRQAPWLFWYDDLSIMDPFFILPLIMGASMVIQQKLNPPPTDPMQQKIMAFLPYVFTIMFLWFPAGLVLYWVVNNILSIAQQWYITRQIEAQEEKKKR